MVHKTIIKLRKLSSLGWGIQVFISMAALNSWAVQKLLFKKLLVRYVLGPTQILSPWILDPRAETKLLFPEIKIITDFCPIFYLTKPNFDSTYVVESMYNLRVFRALRLYVHCFFFLKPIATV